MSYKTPIIILGVLALFLITLLQWNIHQPAAEAFEEHRITIAPGTSSEDIGKQLKEEDLIRSRYAFDFYVWRSGVDDDLKAGEYILSPSMTIPEIARVLSGGEAVSHDITVTIPEGFTVQQIAERLAASGLVEHPNTFLAADIDTSLYPFLPATDNRLPISDIEGYLFPETYRFDPGSSPIAIAQRMMDEFTTRIWRSFESEFVAAEQSVHDIITMASLIEDEVRSADDRAIVSGILWKRLAIGMPLQVDATVVYVTGNRKLAREDLEVDSPYNTYRYRGLPPGPINNPGLGAIRAALRPQESPYLYYLSKPNGDTVFSETLEEHNRAKAQFLR